MLALENFWELDLLRLNLRMISAVYHSIWVQYLSYFQKFWELDPLRLNVRLISAVYHNDLMAIHLSDHWKFWKLDPLKMNFRVISASLYLIAKFWLLRIGSLRLNLGVITAVITVFIIQELSDCRKFLRIKPVRLNVRTISAVYHSIIIYWILSWLLH